MTAIHIPTFGGMKPLVSPHLLGNSDALVATNTKLFRGDLRPFKGLASIVVLPAGPQPNSIYRYPESSSSETQFWFTFADDVNVVRTPIADDTWERVYWTGDLTGGNDYARYSKNDIATSGATYPSTSRRLGVPQPDQVPTWVVSGAATNAEDLNQTVVYAVSFVSDVGEEGMISALSAEAAFKPGQTVTVTTQTAPPAAWTGLTTITKKRIYRSATGSQKTDLQFLVELPLATATYADTKEQDLLGEVCPSRFWEVPPAALRGLTMGANGIAAGFFGSTACFSESFLPHAWPSKYQVGVDHPIVGVGALASGFVFVTKGQPYIMDGADPSSITAQKLPLKQSCVSKRSVVEMEGAVIYASPDGLVEVTNSGADVITHSILTRDEWQAYNPSSLISWQCDRRYYAFYNTGTETGILVFDFTGESPAFVRIDLTPWTLTSGYYDPSRDGLYLCVKQGTNPPEIRRFDADAVSMSYTWRSKLFITPKFTNIACARLNSDFEDGPITFNLYAWDEATKAMTLRYTKSVTANDPFWLPAGYLSTRVYIELVGSSAVNYITVGESLDDVMLQRTQQ